MSGERADGLRRAVDEHAARSIEAILAELAPGPPVDGGPAACSPFEPSALSALAGAVLRHLPAHSPLPAYLGRMLTDGGAAADDLFRRLRSASERARPG